MAKKKCDCPPQGAPLWMATFGDLMSLLLTFFILLVSFSTMQEVKFQEAMGSLQGALGVLKGMPTIPIHENVQRPRGTESTNNNARSVSDEVQTKGEEIKERVENFRNKMAAVKQADLVTISRTEKGLAIRLESRAIFEPGSAILLPEALPLLSILGETLAGYPNPIRVVGHTDSQPTGDGIYATNWELSSARASSVVRFLQGQGLDPVRLSATGKGEWQPVVKNDSEINRARNRRVEVFMDIQPEKYGVQLGQLRKGGSR
jgi:chemotaxis protein MotB